MGKRGKARKRLRKLQQERDEKEERGAVLGEGRGAGEASKRDEGEARAKGSGKPYVVSPTFAFADTVVCGLHGCVVCSYKVLGPGAGKADKRMLANERPEQCLRFLGALRKATGAAPSVAVGLYARGRRMLAVGDGDLSFSTAIARQLYGEALEEAGGKVEEGEDTEESGAAKAGVKESGADVDTEESGAAEAGVKESGAAEAGVKESGAAEAAAGQEESVTAAQEEGYVAASSVESEATLTSVYPHAGTHVRALRTLARERAAPVDVLFQVDATRLMSHGGVGSKEWDTVVFNFPCVRHPEGYDAQLADLRDNVALVRAFCGQAHSVVKSARSSRRCREVHITHKTKPPFSFWDIVSLGKEAGMQFRAAVVLDRMVYRGYANRKALAKEAFPCQDARIYVFSAAGDEKREASVPSVSAVRKVPAQWLVDQSRLAWDTTFASQVLDGGTERLTAAAKARRQAMVTAVAAGSVRTPARRVQRRRGKVPFRVIAANRHKAAVARLRGLASAESPPTLRVATNDNGTLFVLVDDAVKALLTQLLVVHDSSRSADATRTFVSTADRRAAKRRRR